MPQEERKVFMTRWETKWLVKMNFPGGVVINTYSAEVNCCQMLCRIEPIEGNTVWWGAVFTPASWDMLMHDAAKYDIPWGIVMTSAVTLPHNVFVLWYFPPSGWITWCPPCCEILQTYSEFSIGELLRSNYRMDWCLWTKFTAQWVVFIVNSHTCQHGLMAAIGSWECQYFGACGCLALKLYELDLKWPFLPQKLTSSLDEISDWTLSWNRLRTLVSECHILKRTAHLCQERLKWNVVKWCNNSLNPKLCSSLCQI